MPLKQGFSSSVWAVFLVKHGIQHIDRLVNMAGVLFVRTTKVSAIEVLMDCDPYFFADRVREELAGAIILEELR